MTERPPTVDDPGRAPEGKKPPTRALVLARHERAGLRVAGMSLRERWIAALDRARVPAQEIEPGQLADALGGAEDPLLLVDGGSVIEQATLEALAGHTLHRAEVAAVRGSEDDLCPVLVVGAGATRAIAEGNPTGIEDVAALVRDHDGVELTTLELTDPFWKIVHDKRDADTATREMLRRLRLRPGGLAARAVNRHVSLFITRYLLKTPLTPNHVTCFTLLSGLVAAWVASLGGYWSALFGAALMQFSSIVDGCDGEVARLRYLQSTFGEWFDSVADEIVNALFLVAMGHNLYVSWGWHPFQVMGIVSGCTSFLYALVQWHSKAKHGIGMYWWFDRAKLDKGLDRLELWESRSLMRYLKQLMYRDSFLLIYLVVATTWYLLPVMVGISAGGAVVTLAMLLIHIVIKRAKW